MRNFLLAVMISVIPVPVLASDVGVTISIGQPGFYGQITLGNQYPVPQLIYPNPVLAIPPAVAVQQQPVYLYVPPGHAKRWDKYCHRYNACYQPVYFVQRNWYNDVYLPHYQSQQMYPNRQYDNPGRHDEGRDSDRYRDRYDESRRYPQENSQGRHGDRDHPGRGDHKNRDKDDHGNRGKKDHDRGNQRD